MAAGRVAFCSNCLSVKVMVRVSHYKVSDDQGMNLSVSVKQTLLVVS